MVLGLLGSHKIYAREGRLYQGWKESLIVLVPERNPTKMEEDSSLMAAVATALFERHDLHFKRPIEINFY